MKQFKAWPLGSPGFSNYAKSRIQLVESDEYNGPPSLDTLVLLTEAIFPSSLHEDPRFFRCGTGSGWSRLKYAVGQIFIAHTDSGEKQFNVSEFGGNSAAVAISMAYYPENRRASDAVSKLGL
jgi:hypothetical protein